MHKAWSGIEEEVYYISRSSVKFLGHMGRKMDDSNPNLLAVPNCNSDLNPQIVTKWSTKLEAA